MEDTKDSIVKRIEKDIALFYVNYKKVKTDGAAKKVVELSEMYARDSKSYLEKGDYYTSFSCISYAHGLLDAIIAVNEGEHVQ